ncbi:PaaI family thioesterase [Brevibacillus sp. NRS-1366]|uniref:PaaI family thioesterase n=1 Tax=Brevibacillus sp. NRS-1366 TaxID=3233899 RepID=UPI003D1E28F3
MIRNQNFQESLFLKTKRTMEEVPFWKLIGCEVETIDSEVSRIVLNINENIHLNASSLVHGGVYASLLDNVMGLSAKAISQTRVVTTNLNIHFLSNTDKGKIIATGKVIYQSKSAFATQGEVRDQAGNLLAHATANFLALK